MRWDGEIARLRKAALQATQWFNRSENQDLTGSDAVFIALDEALNNKI